MKVLVPIKRVVDYNVKVRAKSDHSGPDLANVKMAMNPFCEIAVEAAIQLKEAGTASETIAITVAPKEAQEQLRAAMAMGIDRAIHVTVDADVETLAVSKVIAAVAKKEGVELVMAGKQSIDGDNNHVPQMVAALLGQPQATYASEVKIDGGKVTVSREVDGGIDTIQLGMPAVVSADLRLNTPRYPSLPNIMKARRKPLDVMSADDLGVDVAPRLTVDSVGPVPERQAGVMVETVDELVQKLKTEAKVIS